MTRNRKILSPEIVMTTSSRGYGNDHQQLRKRLQYVVDAGDAICSRCRRPIQAGSKWHLDHDDFDRSQYRDGPTGPTWHAFCNVQAVSRKRRKRHKSTTSYWTVQWF